MTLDNMTGITKGSYTGFCKSQLITCNRVKECNGVCPFEDALKHADKMQTMNEQHTVDHDRDWIIGCIEHDGFIHTHRGDKANQIILDALSAEAVHKPDYSYEADMVRRLKKELSADDDPKTKCIAQIKVDTEEIVRRIKEEYDITYGWIPCSERLPECGFGLHYLVTLKDGHDFMDDVYEAFFDKYGWHVGDNELAYDDVIAWMPLPKPYREGE